jgi:hypothetical protein
MNNYSIKLLTSLVVVLSLLASLYIGAKVAEGNYFNLAFCCALVAGAFYALFINKYWIFISLAIASFGFRIQPMGPALDPEHLAVLLASGFILSNFWKKAKRALSEDAISKAFILFNRSFIVFTLFLIVHAFITYYYPSPEIVVGFGNLAKQYFSFWVPFAMIWTTVRFVRFLKPLTNLNTCIGYIFLIGILFNICLRTYSSFYIGVGEKDIVTGELIGASALYIPVLNLTDNIYALRMLSPLVALFGIAMLTSQRIPKKSSGPKILWISLVALGVIGALLSMGRATMIITAFLLITFLLIRKHIAAVALIFLLFIFLIVGARIAYETDRDYVPFGLQRSLAMIPGMDMPDAKGDIDNSSLWRWTLAMRAFTEWQSNSRKFFIGRGVHAFTDRDLLVLKYGDPFSTMDVGLRRGATHSGITDLLITIGLLGAILYFFVFIGFVHAIIKILMICQTTKSITYEIVFVSLIFSITMFPIFILGGGGVYNTVSLLFCAALANLAALSSSEFEQQRSAS